MTSTRKDRPDVAGGSGPAGVPGTPGAASMYIAGLLRETREEIARADQKASILLATVGVVVSATAAALVQVKFVPSVLPNGIEWLWWLGAGLVALGAVALGLTIMPVLADRDDGTAQYFGDIARFPGSEAELLGLLALDAARQPDRDVRQLLTLSRAVRRKYRLITGALVAVAGGCLCGVVVSLMA